MVHHRHSSVSRLNLVMPHVIRCDVQESRDMCMIAKAGGRKLSDED